MANATTAPARNTSGREQKVRRISSLPNNMTVGQMVDQCIGEALEQRASDIHFQPVINGLAIRFRVDGSLVDFLNLSQDLESKVINTLKTRADMDVNVRRTPTSGRFFHHFDDIDYDIRLSSVPVSESGGKEDGLNRQRIVLRILDNRSIQVPLNDLGFLPECREMIGRALYRKHGLILATGPTGSGKTTLLYVLTRMIASSKLNIMSVGDPPEYDLPGISQSAVSSVCSFADHIREFLRQDPDVIMAGEIRTPDAAEAVTDAAIMGRLVLSTMHTNSAMLAAYRLGRFGVEQSLVAEALRLVINQRLVPKLCPDCRIRVDAQTPLWIDPIELQRGAGAIGADYGAGDTSIEAYEPGGVDHSGQPCERCRQTGYVGRVGVFEVLDLSKLGDTMRESLESRKIYEAAINEGAIWPLAADAAAKVLNGIITLDDAKKICS